MNYFIFQKEEQKLSKQNPKAHLCIITFVTPNKSPRKVLGHCTPVFDRICQKQDSILVFCFLGGHLVARTLFLLCLIDIHYTSIWLMEWHVNSLHGSSGIDISCLFKPVTCCAWVTFPCCFWCRCLGGWSERTTRISGDASARG